MSNIVKNIIPIETYYASLNITGGEQTNWPYTGDGYSPSSRKRHLKMRRLSRPLKRKEPQRGPSEKMSGHIYFIEDNLLFAIFKVAPKSIS